MRARVGLRCGYGVPLTISAARVQTGNILYILDRQPLPQPQHVTPDLVRGPRLKRPDVPLQGHPPYSLAPQLGVSFSIMSCWTTLCPSRLSLFELVQCYSVLPSVRDGLPGCIPICHRRRVPVLHRPPVRPPRECANPRDRLLLEGNRFLSATPEPVPSL